MRYLFILLFFLSCNNKYSAETATEKTFVNNAPNSKFNLEQNEYMQFRRNYFYDDSLEKNTELMDNFMKRNPEKSNTTNNLNSKYNKGFEKLKLLDSIGNFNLNTWEKLSKTKDSTISIKGNVYKLNINSSIDGYLIEIKDKNNSNLTSINFLTNFPPGISFYVYDIDADNQVEIIAMKNWYIINGDNYDFSIIEIKEN